MPNSIASVKNYTTIIDLVYQRAALSNVLNSGARMVRAGRNAKEIMIPKIQVTGLGDLCEASHKSPRPDTNIRRSAAMK